mmetsp:Transcript_9184/g.28156  ORF Transcript_9184/g.28156 Transcript_9184/m.28156 type:complete len:143 (-) Transcript_9184:341-769(-)
MALAIAVRSLPSRCVLAGLQARVWLASCLAVDEPRLLEFAGLPARLDDADDAGAWPSLWLFAVPKKRSTRSRKRMKTWMDGPKPVTHIQECQDCGKPKLRHKLSKCCVETAVRKTHEAKAQTQNMVIFEKARAAARRDNPPR